MIREAKPRLAAAPFAPSPREAALLLGHVLGLGEAQILARGEHRPEAASAELFLELLERRLAGEPVAYLTGEREFYGRPFTVDYRVLIPRPETEHLVEAVLALELPSSPAILDLGTGSGCLSVTLALELDSARACAVDSSPGALEVARANASRHGVADRVHLVAADLATSLDISAFDLVVSNPPYIDLADVAVLSPEITRFEPGGALFARDAGFAVIRRLLAELAPLRPGAHLLIEIGQGQAQRLVDSTEGSGFALEGVFPDYAGIPRIAQLSRR